MADFTFSLPRYAYQEICALDDITLTIPQGDLVAVVGPNGGGKSTLLKCLAGVLGHNGMSSVNPSQIAYLPQASLIDRTFPLYVEDVVLMGFWPQWGQRHGISVPFPSLIKQKVSELLNSVGLGSFEKRSLTALSGGQLQRLLFARLMAQDAPVLLLDEPFAAVDTQTITDLMGFIMDWHKQGKTILAVLHDMALVRDFFPKTIVLNRCLVAYGETVTTLTRDVLEQAMFTRSCKAHCVNQPEGL